jgi:hypothetical protein
MKREQFEDELDWQYEKEVAGSQNINQAAVAIRDQSICSGRGDKCAHYDCGDQRSP